MAVNLSLGYELFSWKVFVNIVFSQNRYKKTATNNQDVFERVKSPCKFRLYKLAQKAGSWTCHFRGSVESVLGIEPAPPTYFRLVTPDCTIGLPPYVQRNCIFSVYIIQSTL